MVRKDTTPFAWAYEGRSAKVLTRQVRASAAYVRRVAKEMADEKRAVDAMMHEAGGF